MDCSRFLSLVALIAFFEQALATPITVVNPGFEAPCLGSNLPPEYNGDVPPSAFPVGPAPAGWSIYPALLPAGASVGVLNPNASTFFTAGAAEGDNVALLYADGAASGGEFGITQVLGAMLEANTAYTLRVEVGNIASGTSVVFPYSTFGFYNLNGFPGYRVELLAGNTVIAQDNNALAGTIAEGAFGASVVQFVTDASHPQLGQPLTIRLVNRHVADLPGVRGLEVDFDNVRLDAAPVVESKKVPVPAAALLLLALALSIGAFSRLNGSKSQAWSHTGQIYFPGAGGQILSPCSCRAFQFSRRR